MKSGNYSGFNTAQGITKRKGINMNHKPTKSLEDPVG